MSKNNRVIIFSLTVAVIIATFLFITIFAILYFYWGDETSIKDALSTTGAFFGGFATLGAAVVACYLFNDWREQHNKTILANEAKIIFKDISNSYMLLADYLKTVRDNQNFNVTLNNYLLTKPLNEIIDSNKNISKDLKYFEDLASISSITPLIKKNIEQINQYKNFIEKYYSNSQNRTYSKVFLTETEFFLNNISRLNHEYKDILIDFILAK